MPRQSGRPTVQAGVDEVRRREERADFGVRRRCSCASRGEVIIEVTTAVSHRGVGLGKDPIPFPKPYGEDALVESDAPP
jgi:hypothetical protein